VPDHRVEPPVHRCDEAVGAVAARLDVREGEGAPGAGGDRVGRCEFAHCACAHRCVCAGAAARTLHRPRSGWCGRPGSVGELSGRVARWKGHAELAPCRGQHLGARLERRAAEAGSNTGLHAGRGRGVALQPIGLRVRALLRLVGGGVWRRLVLPDARLGGRGVGVTIEPVGIPVRALFRLIVIGGALQRLVRPAARLGGRGVGVAIEPVELPECALLRLVGRRRRRAAPARPARHPSRRRR